ncbi:MAG: response regulator transcription factor [Lachnospiraceae bacterium]|nr:response regulator transcription factor [Lachnospiraceae bacterium]
MLRIAACDGDPPLVSGLEKLLYAWDRAKYLNIRFMQYPTPEDMMADIELHGHIDLVFLRFRPGETKKLLSTARMLKAEDETSEIVFVSSGGLFCREMFAVRPLDLLTEPLQPGQLYDILERCFQQREKQLFFFRSRQRIVALNSEKITYLYHFRRKLHIFYWDGREFETYMRLEEAEMLLKDSDAAFWKAHYSYLVNIFFVEQMKRGLIIMKNGKQIPVSRPYIPRFLSYYEEYLRLRKNGKSVQKNGNSVQEASQAQKTYYSGQAQDLRECRAVGGVLLP